MYSSTYTADQLRQALRERTGGPKDRTPEEARQLLHGELLATGNHKALWHAFGFMVLQWLDIEEALDRPVSTASVARYGPIPNQNKGRKKSPPPSPSWRAPLRAGAVSALDLAWPVGNTGQLKPFGEWEGVDFRQTARYYQYAGEVLFDACNGLNAIGNALKDGETLRQAVKEGKLKGEFDKLVHGGLRIPNLRLPAPPPGPVAQVSST